MTFCTFGGFLGKWEKKGIFAFSHFTSPWCQRFSVSSFEPVMFNGALVLGIPFGRVKLNIVGVLARCAFLFFAPVHFISYRYKICPN